MNNPYLKAAKNMHKEMYNRQAQIYRKGICFHLDNVLNGKKSTVNYSDIREIIKIKNLFNKNGYCSAYWFGLDLVDNTNERQEHRIMALCFAAAMYETGDL